MTRRIIRVILMLSRTQVAKDHDVAGRLASARRPSGGGLSHRDGRLPVGHTHLATAWPQPESSVAGGASSVSRATDSDTAAADSESSSSHVSYVTVTMMIMPPACGDLSRVEPQAVPSDAGQRCLASKSECHDPSPMINKSRRPAGARSLELGCASISVSEPQA